jgi:hypothetical protein
MLVPRARNQRPKKGLEETWISFCERKEREKVMIRQEHKEIANRQTARLTLLENEMASTHRRHLKDYTQHKHTAGKEKEKEEEEEEE